MDHLLAAHMYRGGMSSDAIASVFNVNRSSVKKALAKLGVQMRPLAMACRSFSINEHFFDVIDTEAKAYWLGFLLADGNIGDSGRNRVARQLRCALQRRDEGHLVLLRSAMGSNHPIARRNSSLGNPTSYLSITSKRLVRPLEDAGWYAFKQGGSTDILEMVPVGLRVHLVRGFIDGDGCIHRRKDRGRWLLTYSEGFPNPVAWMRQQWIDLGASPVGGVVKHPSNHCWSCTINNPSAIKVMSAIYSHSQWYLSRKYDLVKQAIAEAASRQ